MDADATPTPRRSIRVVVAEDGGLLRATFVALLDAADGITVVGEAGNGAEAIHVALATHPDVVLMDVMMPMLDGMAATRQLLEAHDRLAAVGIARPRVVMLTDTGGDEYVYEALRDGARGFVSKDARPSELTDTVRIAAGDDAIPWPAEIVRLVARYTPSRHHRPDVAARRAALSTGDALALRDRTQLVVFAYESGLVTPLKSPARG